MALDESAPACRAPGAAPGAGSGQFSGSTPPAPRAILAPPSSRGGLAGGTRVSGDTARVCGGRPASRRESRAPPVARQAAGTSVVARSSGRSCGARPAREANRRQTNLGQPGPSPAPRPDRIGLADIPRSSVSRLRPEPVRQSPLDEPAGLGGLPVDSGRRPDRLSSGRAGRAGGSLEAIRAARDRLAQDLDRRLPRRLRVRRRLPDGDDGRRLPAVPRAGSRASRGMSLVDVDPGFCAI